MRRTTAEALEAEAQCLSVEACSTDIDEMFESCFREAGATIEVTARAADFCGVMGATFFECAWFPSPNSCAQEHARYTDVALAAGRACAGAPCEALEACLEENLWTFGD